MVCITKVVFHLSDVAGSKELVVASLSRKVQDTRVPSRSNFGRSELENWAALIHEQGQAWQNYFWELVRST